MDPKHRGRKALPAAEKKSAQVNVAMQAKLYDRTYQAARDARMSVPETMREALRRYLTASSTR